MEIDRHKATVADVVKRAREAARATVPAVTEPAVATTADKGAKIRAAVAKANAKTEIQKAALDDSGIVHGFGGVAANIDLDDETLKEATLASMAYDFCASKGRTFKVNHGEKALPNAELVATQVGSPIVEQNGTLRTIAATESLTELEKAGAVYVGLDTRKGAPTTHWEVAFRPNDDNVVEELRKGGGAGFSWAGFCDRTEG